MPQEVKVPELAEGVESAVVVKVLVEPGDRVQQEQALLELETDKATAELPSPVAGEVVEIKVAEGDEVQVGQVIMTVETAAGEQQQTPAQDEPDEKREAAQDRPQQEADAEQPEREKPEKEQSAEKESAREEAGKEQPKKKQPEKEQPEKEQQQPRKEQPRKEQPEAAAGGEPEISPEAHVPAGPAVRRLARELGIDVSAVAGSGPRDRISLEDVKAHARAIISQGRGRPGGQAAAAAGPVPQQPELPDFSRWGPVEREPLSGVRRATARAVARSWGLVPHVTQHDRADVTELEQLRQALKPEAEQRGVKLSITAILLKVVASALQVFPRFNTSIDMERNEYIVKRFIHLGVAVDAEHGLLVPVLRDVDRSGLYTIAEQLGELSQQARDKKLPLEAMRGASFTVSNLGGLGTTDFSPVVGWPQVGMLGVGRAATEAVWRQERFMPRSILPLSLSYDHRANDGADAARFLRWIAQSLEQPLRLLLED